MKPPEENAEPNSEPKLERAPWDVLPEEIPPAKLAKMLLRGFFTVVLGIIGAGIVSVFSFYFGLIVKAYLRQ